MRPHPTLRAEQNHAKYSLRRSEAGGEFRYTPPLRESEADLAIPKVRLGLDTILSWPTLYEQALVCLSNREIVDASRGCTFHCKMANNRLITVFSLIVLA